MGGTGSSLAISRVGVGTLACRPYLPGVIKCIKHSPSLVLRSGCSEPAVHWQCISWMLAVEAPGLAHGTLTPWWWGNGPWRSVFCPALHLEGPSLSMSVAWRRASLRMWNVVSSECAIVNLKTYKLRMSATCQQGLKYVPRGLGGEVCHCLCGTPACTTLVPVSSVRVGCHQLYVVVLT